VERFSIDEGFVDITRTFQFFGRSPEETVYQIKAAIRKQTGLTCSVGMGPNKLIAKVAAGLRKPDGFFRVRQVQLSAFLEALPVEVLCGVGPRVKRKLNDLGVMTCGQLGRTSSRLLHSRFGVFGKTLHLMGKGIDLRPVLLSEEGAPAKSIGHAYTLPRDIHHTEQLQETLFGLAEAVARRLRADGVCGRTVHLSVRYADFSSYTRSSTLVEATDTAVVLYQTVWALFEKHCVPLKQRVRLLGVSVSGLSRGYRQLSFLPSYERYRRIDKCMDALNARFGENSLVRARTIRPLVQKTHGFMK